ncbi:AAA family ATPase [Methylobacterium sp. J-070]|uniref:AAA family ATPase n=1 Tax=Methylobacterium sp. J-070 TaxID=2836650 RepID=UPI001FBB5922|nr:AAA family ATPase [Methylobacterium sp. J-070]MCJ2054518.1 AAA family ATPase [Methylobacterium sp. J-070]
MVRSLKKPLVDDVPTEEYLGVDQERAGTALRRAGSSLTLLASLLLEEAMTPEIRHRVTSERGLAVLVEAPSAAWVPHLRRALAQIAKWGLIEGRDGSYQARRKPTDGAAELVEAVAAGQRVAVICHAPEAHVPPAFIAAADLRLRTGRPTAALVAAAIRALTGRTPRKLPTSVEGLDLPELALALRSGAGGATGCVKRLQRTLAARASSAPLREVPLVHNLHGMGEPGGWARRLVDDFHTMRPELFWREADKCSVWAGDPGTGKTSLAHSLALSLGLEFRETSVAAWFEGSSYLDKTIAALVEAFAGARARGREGRGVILFCDELDALPSREGGEDDRTGSYWKPMQQAYLREVEATAAAGERVILIGATNHPRRLDPALLRPGRFGRVISVPRPDASALEGILRQHLGEDLAEADLARAALAGLGGTGADVTAWVRGARRSARVAGRSMTLDDLLDEVLPPDDRSADDLWRCAVHEAAHGVVAHAFGGQVRKVSIVASGRRGGSTVIAPGDAQTLGKDGLQALVVSALAGRAAEEAFGLGVSTGAHDDLAHATGIAASARVSFGLGGTLVHRAPMERAATLLEGDPELRASVGRDLQRAYVAASGHVRDRRNLVEALARLLLTERVVDGGDFMRLMAAHDRAQAALDGQEACHG